MDNLPWRDELSIPLYKGARADCGLGVEAVRLSTVALLGLAIYLE